MFRVLYTNFDAGIGVSAYADVVITDDKKNLIFSSIAGSDSAVKALIAVGHGTHARFLQIEDPVKTGRLKSKEAHIEGDQRFRSLTSKIGDLTHGIIVSTDAVADTESKEPVMIAWDGDILKAFYETLVAKYPVPLLPEWSTYLFNESVKRGFVNNLIVSSVDKPILAARLQLDQEKLESIVKDGFRSGILVVPEGEHDGGALEEIKDVTGYLNSYGSALANRLQDVFKPHHRPGIDELDPKLNSLYRKPFRAQADVAMGITKALQSSDKAAQSFQGNGIHSLATSKGAIIVGEMGSGKTILGITVAHLLHQEAYRVIIMAPGHLVKKWKREVEITVPNAKGIILHDFKDVIGLRSLVGSKPSCPEFYIISRDRAKLGYYNRCAAKWVDIRPSKGSRVARAHRTGWVCPSCGEIQLVKKDNDMVPAEYEEFQEMKTTNQKCSGCGTKLWSADNKRVRRVAPVDILKNYFKGFFDLFIADEIHELKGASAQGNALGALIGISKKTLGLTGTLMGGYASNLFRILFRLNSHALLNEEITYKSESKFVGRYGILEKTFKRTEESVNSMSRGGKGKTTVKEKPGVSPQVFTRFLLPSCAFLELADLSEHLPSYTEQIEIVQMDEEQEDAYKSLAKILKKKLEIQLRLGKKGLLGTYLNTLLLYPDRPFNNEPIADKKTREIYAIPRELDSEVTYAKERRLIDIVMSEKAKGRRSLVYAHFTGKKDVQSRLAALLREKGLKVEILRATVKPENRESWVEEKVRKGVDVIITNPKLVETGLDLLEFPSIIFYETGYNLYTLRQASRRSWRIGQKLAVRVYFMCYQNTLQEAALRLMGTKLEASMSLEGKFSEEGLRSMGDGLDLSSALAKALVEGMDGVDSAESIWSRMGYGIIGSDEDDVPEITRVTNTGEVELVKVVLVNRTSRKAKKSEQPQQYGWDFFAEGA